MACVMWQVRGKAGTGSSPCTGCESGTHPPVLPPAPESTSEVSKPGCFLPQMSLAKALCEGWLAALHNACERTAQDQPCNGDCQSTKHRPNRSWSGLMSHSPFGHQHLKPTPQLCLHQPLSSVWRLLSQPAGERPGDETARLIDLIQPGNPSPLLEKAATMSNQRFWRNPG